MKKQIRAVAITLSLMFAVPVLAQEARVVKVDRVEKLDRKMKDLKVSLDLNDKQFGEIRSILDENEETLKATRKSKGKMKDMSEDQRKQARSEMKEARMEMRKATDEKIKAVLTPEQVDKYKNYKKEQREIRKENIKESVGSTPYDEKL